MTPGTGRRREFLVAGSQEATGMPYSARTTLLHGHADGTAGFPSTISARARAPGDAVAT